MNRPDGVDGVDGAASEWVENGTRACYIADAEKSCHLKNTSRC